MQIIKNTCVKVKCIGVRCQQLPHHTLIPRVHRHQSDLSETEISYEDLEDLWWFWKLMDVGNLHCSQCLQTKSLLLWRGNGVPREISFRSWKDTRTGNVLQDSQPYHFKKSNFPTGPNGTACNHESSSEGHFLEWQVSSRRLPQNKLKLHLALPILHTSDFSSLDAQLDTEIFMGKNSCSYIYNSQKAVYPRDITTLSLTKHKLIKKFVDVKVRDPTYHEG